jgi:hypothetical protein
MLGVGSSRRNPKGLTRPGQGSSGQTFGVFWGPDPAGLVARATPGWSLNPQGLPGRVDDQHRLAPSSNAQPHARLLFQRGDSFPRDAAARRLTTIHRAVEFRRRASALTRQFCFDTLREFMV